MNEESSPNSKIDKAIQKLLKDCEGPISPEQESGLKVKADVLRVAIAWEKIKHGIKDKDEEGTQWGDTSGQ